VNKNIIIIGNDHNGLEQKNFLKKILKKKFIVIDVGNYNESEKIDYNDPANQLVEILNDNPSAKGILICGTGVGMSIVSNKDRKIRSVLAHSVIVAKKSRNHNDSNVLCLGSWINTKNKNLEIVSRWLNTDFEEGRHIKRVDKIDNKKKYNVSFVNGVFDLIHPGHLELLSFAKSISKKVVVAINSDSSTKKLKGQRRPVVSELDRKVTLLNLYQVDEVLIFDDLKPTNIIKKVNPDVVIRGDDYDKHQVRKRDKIPAHIDIKIIKKKSNFSTTRIIKKIDEFN